MLMERTQLGLIEAFYFNEATLDTTWHVYPYLPERLDLTSRPGWLRILPGSRELYVLRNTPVEDFLCECRIDFVPTLEVDGAGLCIFNSEDMVIKLLSYYNPDDPAVYDRLRFIKKGDVFEAWARTSDGIWQMKGGTRYPAGAKVGFFLAKDSTRPVEIDQFVFVKSTVIQVDNLPPDSRVLLIKDGAVIFDQVEINNQVMIDLETWQELIIRAQIIVLNKDGVVTAETGNIDIAGGDIFWHSYINLDVFYNGEPFSLDVDNMLGTLHNGILELKLHAHNPDKYEPVTSSMVSVEPEPGFYGYDWVQVASDMGGVPAAWGKVADIGGIPADGYKAFWLRIAKRPLLALAPELHKFRLKVVGGTGGVS